MYFLQGISATRAPQITGGKMVEKKKEKQPNLFGEIDQVFNALDTELTMVKEEIEARHKKIGNLEDQIQTLEGRKEKLVEAVEIVAKQKKDAEAKAV